MVRDASAAAPPLPDGNPLRDDFYSIPEYIHSSSLDSLTDDGFQLRQEKPVCTDGVSRIVPFIVGIVGGSGSGKTTLAEGVMSQIGDKGKIISHDSYYHDFSNLTFEERCNLNFDHPNSLETSLLVEHLRHLKAGKTIEVPTYRYDTHARDNNTVVTVHPCPVIIVEGILLMENEELCELLDLKVFVDVAADIRFTRRLQRDVEERGRTPSSVISQYEATVRPMHMKFVEPTKERADIIVTNGRSPIARDVISFYIKAQLDTK
jgi:uridine kinase